ncbi:MAG: hypothetical protein IJC33_00275 [Clostridia bacterium]|nr:hypothetical protein [Clostridia bacterium]
MKKRFVFILALAVVVLLAGCTAFPANEGGASSAPSEVSSTTSTTTSATYAFTRVSDNVLKIGTWTEFSEDELKAIIGTYQEQYSAFVFTNADGAKSITFETDFDAVGCMVARLSKTDDTDINVELNGYIDLYLEATCTGNQVTVPVDWWSQRDINNSPVWSYLVRVSDSDGVDHYYYFRTDYTDFLQTDD